MHYSSKYWQEPHKFNPNRFDPNHPDSKTPDGKKRPQMVWLPFNGGKRICFGKTFADLMLRLTSTIISQKFNLEFVEEGKYGPDNLPLNTLGMSHNPKIPFKLTKY